MDRLQRGYTDMAYDTNTQTQDTRSPYEKLAEYKIGHLRNVAAQLGMTQDQINGCGDNVVYLANSIKAHHSMIAINDAHYEVTRRYSNGGRGIYRKGRPLGSKNRRNNYNSNNNSQSVPTIDEIFTDESSDFVELNETKKPETTQIIEGNLTLEQVAQLVEEVLGTTLKAWDQRNETSHNNLAHKTNVVQTNLDKLHIRTDDWIAETTRRIAEIENRQPTTVILENRVTEQTIDLGLQHKQFPKLLKYIAARQSNNYGLNIWIHGPAGTGKSVAAENVVKALGLKFYVTGSLAAKHEVLGFCNAHTYVSTPFRQAWEHGGIYCMDEADGSSPQAMLALNGALAGKYCEFPDRTEPVLRHKDCIIICTANTMGVGATIEYSGRFKQDAASMNRFVMLSWQLDEGLEEAFTTNKDWLAIVRKYRAKLAKVNIKGVMITPRATVYGEALLAAGVDLVDVIESVIRGPVTDEQWKMIENA